LYGDKTFNPDGSAALGTDTLKDANGNMLNIIKPNNPVPMNGRERYSGQAKLTFQITPLMKLSVSGVGSQQTYHDYTHAYRLNPNGDVTKYDNGFDGSVLWTHTLGEASYYTVNFSLFKRQYKEYLYANPFDSRYNLEPTAFNTNLYEFLRAGTNLHHFDRFTQTQDLKVDYTNQVSELHQIKFGGEWKQDKLYLQDYSVTPLADTAVVNGIQRIGYFATIPPVSSPLYQQYDVNPISYSGYVQDKLEYKSMIVNIGVRYDYFDSKGEYPADPQDPNVYLPQETKNQGLSLDQRMSYWYKKATAKYSISPRFGISYPITDKGVLHFSYGHFLQVPSYQYLYQNPGFKVDAVNPFQGVYGNPDLKPQITVMYEIGLQQQMTDDLSFDVTGFYKDTRDWVGTSPAIPVRDSSGLTATTYYTMFVNKDYANARGVTITLNKRLSDYWSFDLSYTYQTVEGLNSNPDEAQAALLAHNQPTEILVPLDWDQRHTLNATLGFGESDWGISLLSRFGSGLPYSPVVNQADPRGVDVALAVQKNSRRRPDSFNLDLRTYKDIDVGPLKCSVFLRVFNLLDSRNEVYVYGQTGRSTATPEQLGVGGGITGINRVNTVDEYIVRPDYYSEPRSVQVGLDVNF
jgi:outer membrane receptor for ferrienterochelin and colicin